MDARTGGGLDTFNCVFLEGFIAGTGKVYQLVSNNIAVPAGVTYGQLHLSVRKYFNDHPEELREVPQLLILRRHG